MKYFNLTTLRKGMKPLQVLVVAAALFMAGSVQAGGSVDTHTLDSLVQTIKEQQRQLEALQKQVEHLKEMASTADHHAKAAMTEARKTQEKYGVTLYGSLRPSLTYKDSDLDNNTSYNVTDFLSRVGVKGEVAINEGLTAIYQGEWDVDIEGNGDFGKARQAYVGLRTGLGQIAIGKQWDPHFNTVAEVTDIFNHISSPFAYDDIGPFRTNNLVTYTAHLGGLTVNSGLRFDGHSDNNDSSVDGSASQPDDADSGSIGIGYRMGPMYAGVSYLEVHHAEDREQSLLGVAASMDVTENLYLAVTYQDIEDEDRAVMMEGLEMPVAIVDLDQSSLDIAAAMALGGGYTLKASYFDWDGDEGAHELLGGMDGELRSFDGYNLTLERQLSEQVHVHAEYLQRDIDDQGEEDFISIGFRYDFEAEL